MSIRLSAGRTGSPWPAWAAFLALASVICWDKVFGPYALVRLFDSFESEYPHYTLQARMLLDHGLFGWNPFMPGGMPALAGQHGPLHPMVLACAALPPWLVSAGLDLFLLSLGGWGLYRLGRDFAGASRPLAATGAALFTVSLIPVLRHFLLAHAFPACFVWLARATDPGRSRASRLASALALAATLALAYPVLSLPVAMVHLLLAAALVPADRGRARLCLAVFLLWTGYALFSAPVIAGLWDFLPLAHRAREISAAPLGRAVLDFARVFLCQFWEGQPCFPFLVLGLPLLATRGPARALFAAALLVALIRGLGNSELRFILGNSPLAKPDWAVVFQLTPALLAGLAVAVLERMRARPPKPAWAVAALAATLALGRLQSSTETFLQVLALAVGLAAVALARGREPGGPEPSCWLDRLPRVRAPLLAASLSLALMTAAQYQFLEHPHVPYAKGFSGPPLVETPGPGPFRTGSADLHPAVALGQGLETVGQKRPLFNRYWKELAGLAIAPQLAAPAEAERFRREIYHLLLTPRRPGTDLFLAPAKPPERSIRDFNPALLAAMNVRFLLSPRPMAGLENAPPPRLVRLGGAPLKALRGTALDRFLTQEVWVQPLPGAFERAFLAPRAEVLDTREAVLARLGRADVRKLADTAFFFAGDLAEAGNGAGADAATGMAAPPQASPAPLAVAAPDPDHLVAQGVAPGPSWLVVSNNFDPGWTATVNGVPAPVLRADHAFQAVRVEAAGPFRAELAYASAPAKILPWAVAAGLGLMLLPAVIGPGKTRNEQKRGAPASGGFAPDQPAQGQPLAAPPASLFQAAPLWAALAAVAWAAGFSFAPYLKGVAKGDPRPLGYVLAVVPVLGALSGCWTRALLLRYFRASAPVPPGRSVS